MVCDRVEYLIRAGSVLILCVVGSWMLAPAETTDEQEDCRNESHPCGWKWGPLGEEQFTLSLAHTHETDPGGDELRGIRIVLGRWEELESEFGGGMVGLWLSVQRGDELEVLGAGVEAGILIAPLGPVRLFPRLTVGPEYRTASPDSGLSGLIGAGGEFGVWLGRRFLLYAVAERQFGFPSGTSNQVALGVRVGLGKTQVPFWPFR